MERETRRDIMRTSTLHEMSWWAIADWETDERMMLTKQHPFMLPDERLHHIESKDQTWLPRDGAVCPEVFEMLKEL